MSSHGTSLGLNTFHVFLCLFIPSFVSTLVLTGNSKSKWICFCALETGTLHSGDNRIPSPNLDEDRGFLWILEPHGMKELGSLSLANGKFVIYVDSFQIPGRQVAEKRCGAQANGQEQDWACPREGSLPNTFCVKGMDHTHFGQPCFPKGNCPATK